MVATIGARQVKSLRQRLGDLGKFFRCRPGGWRLQMQACETFLQRIECLLWRIARAKELEVFGGYGAGLHQHVQIQNLAPVLLAVDDYQDLLGQLLRLRESEDLE